MAKLTKSRLGQLRIVNNHDFAENDQPVITYISDVGRGGRGRGWEVWMRNRRIDAKGAWYDNGAMTFRGASKAEQFELAKAWATERYGVKEWARTPFGSWMDAEFVKKRMAALAELDTSSRTQGRTKESAA